MAEAQLTDTAIAGLRTKLDQIVSQMLADGQSDETIQTVVDDFKARHYPKPEAESPSMLGLAGTALGQTARNLVMAPVNLARTVLDTTQEAQSGDSPMAALARAGNPLPILGALARRFVVDPAVEQGRQALDAGREGRASEAVGHGAAALLPVLGPAAANIGEQLGTGDPETMARGVGDAAALALAPAAMRAAGRGAQAVGRAAQRGGRSAFLRAAKIPESIAKKTETFRKTGDLAAAEQEIAGTVLESGRGAITRRNVDALNAQRRAVSRGIGEAVDDITTPVSPVPTLRAMAQEVRKLRREHDTGIGAARGRYREMRERFSEDVPVVRAEDGGLVASRAPQTAEQAAMEGFGLYQPIRVEMRARPRPLSARELQNFNIGAGQRNAARFSQRGEPVSPAVARVDMAGSAAGRQTLKDASPALARLSQQHARIKPAAQALTKALQRVGHHDPVGLIQAILAAGGAATMGPFGALMALLPSLQRGGPLSAIGQRLYNAGQTAGRTGAAMRGQTAGQAALVSQLLNED